MEKNIEPSQNADNTYLVYVFGSSPTSMEYIFQGLD